jgi:hypothetical protein
VVLRQMMVELLSSYSLKDLAKEAQVGHWPIVVQLALIN